MKIKSLLTLLTILFLYTACSDSSTDVEPELKETNQMLSFVLEQSTNAAYLEEDVVGVIENDEIQLTIDRKVDATKLIATFTHTHTQWACCIC